MARREINSRGGDIGTNWNFFMREICTYLHAQEKGLANIRERGKNKIMKEDQEGENSTLRVMNYYGKRSIFL